MAQPKIPMNAIGIRHLAIRLDAIANSLDNNQEINCRDYERVSGNLMKCVNPLVDLIDHYREKECGRCKVCDYNS